MVVLAALRRARWSLVVIAAVVHEHLTRGVVEEHLLALRARILVECILEAIFAEGALAALPTEVEAAAEVSTGREGNIALVGDGGNSTAGECEEEGKATEAATDDGDAGVGGSSGGRHALQRKLLLRICGWRKGAEVDSPMCLCWMLE